MFVCLSKVEDRGQGGHHRVSTWDGRGLVQPRRFGAREEDGEKGISCRVTRHVRYRPGQTGGAREEVSR